MCFQDASVNASGVLGGGQIGFDYQSGWTVFGIQADADAAGIRGATSCFPEVASIPGVISSQQSCSTKISFPLKWNGTQTERDFSFLQT